MGIPENFACLLITIWRFTYRYSCLIGLFFKEFLPFCMYNSSLKSTCNSSYILNGNDSNFACLLIAVSGFAYLYGNVDLTIFEGVLPWIFHQKELGGGIYKMIYCNRFWHDENSIIIHLSLAVSLLLVFSHLHK